MKRDPRGTEYAVKVYCNAKGTSYTYDVYTGWTVAYRAYKRTIREVQRGEWPDGDYVALWPMVDDEPDYAHDPLASWEPGRK
jgi:hypothetical protein